MSGYTWGCAVDFVEQPCRTALNRVSNMSFKWSLNPYMGCAHRCTFCYVRGFERRADRPSDDRYGRTVRVKVNVADVLRAELARKSWRRELVAIGAATDPYQPGEGRYRLTRACLQVLGEARNPFSLITRGPMVVRDIDVLAYAARRTEVDVTFSIPTLNVDVWRRTEPGTAQPRARRRTPALASRRCCPGSPTIPRGLPPSSAQRGMQAPPLSGATCSTFSPARVSISSIISRATGRSCSTGTGSCIVVRISTARTRSRSALKSPR
jgi:hypothetical protein